jgi:hypothetical protein
MGASRKDEDTLLLRAVDSIFDGETVDQAFNRLVEVLREPLDLWHMSLSLLRPDTEEGVGAAQYIAAWSMASSAFQPGTEVSLRISDSAIASSHALRRGKIVLATVPSEPGSLIDGLLREQGVATVAVVPIHGDAAGVLVLTLGSSAEEPLRALGERFFRGLAAGIEGRLLQLLASRS